MQFKALSNGNTTWTIQMNLNKMKKDKAVEYKFVGKPKPLIQSKKPKTFWGYFTCQFCNKRMISYMHDRHVNSKAHNEILLKQNAFQVYNDFTIELTGNVDKKLLESLKKEVEKIKNRKNGKKNILRGNVERRKNSRNSKNR